jgi:hypothetical protein
MHARIQQARAAAPALAVPAGWLPCAAGMMSLLPLLVRLLCAAMLALVATTIDNGLGRTPP